MRDTLRTTEETGPKYLSRHFQEFSQLAYRDSNVRRGGLGGIVFIDAGEKIQRLNIACPNSTVNLFSDGPTGLMEAGEGFVNAGVLLMQAPDDTVQSVSDASQKRQPQRRFCEASLTGQHHRVCVLGLFFQIRRKLTSSTLAGKAAPSAQDEVRRSCAEPNGSIGEKQSGDERRQAQQAINELKRAGFRKDEIGVISQNQDEGAARTEATDRGSHAGTGAVTGAVTGAGAGALWALGIAAGVLPAIGPVVAGGILASVLASAAGTAVAGGIVGALLGLGDPEEEARYYESEFKAGRTIVTVKTDTRCDEARGILQRFGAYDRSTGRPATSTSAACATATTPRVATAEQRAATAGQSMKVHEEQMHVHKHPQQTGEVKVHKEVHTEHKTIDVPVEREEVVVERRPASGPATASELREGQEIRVPIKEEQISVEKQAVVKEEVEGGKRKIKDTETVSGDVRKEEVKVEQEGNVRVQNPATRGNAGKRS